MKEEGAARAALAARVSRETMDRLERYAAVLEKWQGAINLVSPATLPTLWHRHMLDSAQLMDLAPNRAETWLDLGSGGGFPGLVCAAIAPETQPDLRFSLVESDLRKGAFLREAARAMGVAVSVFTRRVEDLPPTRADVVSARALAPLSSLCRHASRHLAPGGVCLFLKGARAGAELETAREDWQVDVTKTASVTDAEAVILKLENLRHA
jgi:16S rRNA (guanine527-N7)-methyltransferase